MLTLWWMLFFSDQYPEYSLHVNIDVTNNLLIVIFVIIHTD